jgi:hypothetical protein
MTRRLLNEFLAPLREEPETGPDAPYGKYAFDAEREDVPPAEKEEPTPEEAKALDALKAYMGPNDHSKLDPIAPELLSLAQKGKYSPVLDPSGAQFVYRILILARDVASQRLNVKIDDQTPFGMAGPGTMQATRSITTGWTSDIKLADSWIGGKGDTIVIYKATVKGNSFFGKPGDLAKAIGAPPDTVAEMETIAVGPVKYVSASFALKVDAQGKPISRIAAKKAVELISA